MNQSLKPRPCPFCGSKKIKLQEYHTEDVPFKVIYWLLCSDCQANGPVGNSEKHAVELWGMIG